MKQKILDLKELLATAIETEALTSEKVINISQKLDKVIVEYIKEFGGKQADVFDKHNNDK